MPGFRKRSRICRTAKYSRYQADSNPRPQRIWPDHGPLGFQGSYPTLPTKSKPPSTSHLQQVQHARSHGQVRRAHELNANKREIHLTEVKYCEDTRPGPQLEASNKKHESLCTLSAKAKQVMSFRSDAPEAYIAM